MPSKNVKSEPTTSQNVPILDHHVEEEREEEKDEEVDDEDEWEETTMVATVNGILDADMVRDAIAQKMASLRYAGTANPVLQLNNSLYTGTWTKDLGTNIVLQTKEKEQLEVIACSSTILQAEKALLTSMKNDGSAIASEADSVPKSALSRTVARGKN